MKITNYLQIGALMLFGAVLSAKTVAAPLLNLDTRSDMDVPTYLPEAGSDLEKKTTKTSWKTTPNPELPNVLILGDSISISYTLQVRAQLEGKANVFRPHAARGRKPENCQGTTNGVRHIDRWLQGRKWDVIHFNWGLHDLKHVDPKTGKNSESFDDPRQAEPDQYEKQLVELVTKLKATGAQLIFATTTPYPEGPDGPARLPEDVELYNSIALEIMQEQAVSVNELYTLCLGKLDTIQLPHNVHFNSAGQALLADAVAEKIEAVLP
ncbi:SGNH/GDSL hydrolase family protein [Coraliomargarita sp. SDUM461003]|uniref:SGNH/GDSL hydrolase family protein n=1 Tax=Thalassobacterium maritimum TaxID=3041265 RepID=A0ABU1AVZ4_9BACT|nr:SGNH/GDSL hydrolase family protein [Coraliomargarita sp. SDUM461003]MDQ8208251.1 SGNH/GDSL hydrolase family protein [Coraliomargarita sp. SDUM461003]